MHDEIDVLSWCRNSVQRAKKQAGARYAPGLDAAYPSLPIEGLLIAYDGLARNVRFWKSLVSQVERISLMTRKNTLLAGSIPLPKELDESTLYLKRRLPEIVAGITSIDARCSQSFRRFSIARVRGDLERCQKQVGSLYGIVVRKRGTVGDKAADEWHEESHVNYLLKEARELLDALRGLQGVIDNAAIGYANDPIALLLGRAGTGKTHFLCDLAEEKLKAGKATFIVLAGNLPAGQPDLWSAIIRATGLRVSRKQFVQAMCRQSSVQKERVLVIIDAINEGDRQAWKAQLPKLIEEIRTTPGLALLLSCRTPFEELMFSSDVRDSIVKLFHPGFSGIEYKAQDALFHHYQLPSPTVPLLSDEFSNPLFLKLFCESLNHATVKRQHKQITEIGSGQKGMTFIFERFIEYKQKRMLRQLQQSGQLPLFRHPDWLWSQGSNPSVVKRVASSMAAAHTDYVTLEELDQTLLGCLSDPARLLEVRQRLLSEGVFVEGVEWRERKPLEVVRFTYQRLSDHLVAREVLKSIKCTDKRQVRNLYRSTRELPNRLEALMVEFPTRSGGQELILQIPPKELTYAVLESFINSLYWRDSAAFTEDTSRVTGHCLGDPRLREQAYEVLFSLGIRSGHPYSASALDRHLSKLRLPDRDLQWSEFLRSRESTSAVNKLLRYVLEPSGRVQDAKVATCCVLLLKWLLTSTNRHLRDRATMALVTIGTAHPSILFQETIKSLAANDPYVPERMLAATYGVAMRLYANPKGEATLGDTLAAPAKRLYQLMFAPRAKHSTTHVLTRAYARDVIGIALRLSPRLLPVKSRARLMPPYRDGGLRNWGTSTDRDEGKYRDGDAPIHMDFGNYTLGRLVRNRNNYDDTHPGYLIVRQNIFWRIYDLGYELARFSQADQSIVRESSYYRDDNPGGVDRYGKKYSWIAYFELYGHRQDQGLLEDRSYGDRPSDSDLDPSFPGELSQQAITDRDFLGSRGLTTKRWITHGQKPSLDGILQIESISGDPGPWLLLDGGISQEDLPTKRRFDLWIHSRIVTRTQLKLLQGLPFEGVDGAREFSHNPTSHYTFAGEIPWNDTWPLNEPDGLEFEMGKIEEIRSNTRLVMYRSGKRLSDKDSDARIDQMVRDLGRDFSEDGLAAYLNNHKLNMKQVVTRKKVTVPRRIVVHAENTVRQLLWESYHSSLNGMRNPTLPSRQLCDSGRLKMAVPGWDFVDLTGRRAVVVVKSGEQFGPGQEFTYIRQDLLDQYLKRRRAVLIWSVSGERRVLYKDDDGEFREPPRLENVYRVFYMLYCYDKGTVSTFARKPEAAEG
jgi:hypothetical protein